MPGLLGGEKYDEQGLGRVFVVICLLDHGKGQSDGMGEQQLHLGIDSRTSFVLVRALSMAPHSSGPP